MNTLRFGFRPFLPALFNEIYEHPVEEKATYRPAANVREDEKSYFIDLALPGFDKKEISLSFEDEVLTVSAGKEVHEVEKSPKFTWNEFGYKERYERSFQLPETVDADAIAASFDKGILTVTLPKKEAKPTAVKQIAIA